jgi:hypothetical protein
MDAKNMDANQLLTLLEEGSITWDDVLKEFKADPVIPIWVIDLLESTMDKDPCGRANWFATLADLADGQCRGLLKGAQQC